MEERGGISNLEILEGKLLKEIDLVLGKKLCGSEKLYFLSGIRKPQPLIRKANRTIENVQFFE